MRSYCDKNWTAVSGVSRLYLPAYVTVNEGLSPSSVAGEIIDGIARKNRLERFGGPACQGEDNSGALWSAPIGHPCGSGISVVAQVTIKVRR